MGSNSYGQLKTSYVKANRYNNAKGINMGHRNYNNVFNPMNDGEEPCCEDCLESEKRCITLKLFPSKEQFEFIKLYYLDRDIDMNITNIFELTDKQFNELLEIHMKTLGDRTKATQSAYINRLRDFYSYFYRDTPKERKDFIKLLKNIDIEPDMDPNGDDVNSLKYNGMTEAQRAYINLFELLLSRSSYSYKRDERIKQEEEYYETILIPKFDDLAKRGMVGKRWWLSFESAFRNFSVEFIKKYLTRFSGKFLLSKRMEYSELRENPDIKEIIKLRLEENIKDELGIYGIKDGLVNVDVDFDLDQVSLFKYLEEDNSYDSLKECCDSGY